MSDPSVVYTTSNPPWALGPVYFSYHCLQNTEPPRTTHGCFIATLEDTIITMFFFYQNIGPGWMLVLFTKMAIEIPNAAIHHILDRQASWEEQTHIKS